jgi:hypothetical protein
MGCGSGCGADTAAAGGSGCPAGDADRSARAVDALFGADSAWCAAGATGSAFGAGSGAASNFGALTGASVSVTGCDAGEAAWTLEAGGAGAAADTAAGASDTDRRVAT